MPKRDIKVKYNLKSELLKNQFNKKETFVNIQQNTDENTPESIYSPNFEQYPMWPYETNEDFENNPYEQQPDNNMNTPTYTPPYNQPAYNLPSNQPAYNQPTYNLPSNQPAYNQPTYNRPSNQPAYNRSPYIPPYSQPAYNPPFYYGTPIVRNPYVPVGRERISSGYSRTTLGLDRELMRVLYKDINKTLYPVIVEVLNEYEYDGSPIYEENIDPETISQLVDRVLRRAGEISDNIQEIMLNDQNISFSETEYMPEWDSTNLLKAAVESILLHEIFEVRRPYYRKVRSRYNYNNGVYNGINYY